MVNYEKTEEEFRKAGVPYDAPLEYQAFKDWKRSVSSDSGNFNQDPDHPEIKYPIMDPFHIKRKYILKEGKEYLTTVEMYTGVDANRNEVTTTLNEPQCYDVPIIQRTNSQSQDNVHITVPETKVTGYKQNHTTPFTEKAFKEVYGRANNLTVEMTAEEVGRGKKPESVFDPNIFANFKFADLLESNTKKKEDKESK